jgi:WD40 repeat protein
VPFKGRITAFASSKNTQQRVYGMNDGTIYLYNEKNGKVTKLEGHLSRISKLKFNGYRLFSSSYDGTVRMWSTNSEKIEPMTLFTTRGWIINFTFDLKKTNVWTGDQNGNLTKALISVPQMQQRLQDKLKRNLTREEWNYYVGRNVPYEEIKGKEARP